ncbi:MAG: hypothetical protein LBK25_06785 [Treponema sp.]|jgi:hypothetical protein|nr:hypothetical protein [Treponema sp.]
MFRVWRTLRVFLKRLTLPILSGWEWRHPSGVLKRLTLPILSGFGEWRKTHPLKPAVRDESGDRGRDTRAGAGDLVLEIVPLLTLNRFRLRISAPFGCFKASSRG